MYMGIAAMLRTAGPPGASNVGKILLLLLARALLAGAVLGRLAASGADAVLNGRAAGFARGASAGLTHLKPPSVMLNEHIGAADLPAPSLRTQ